MTDQTPDPWALMVQKWRGDAGVLRAAANPLSASDMEAAKMEEGAATLLYCAEQVDRTLAAERAQHQQEIEKRDGDFEAVLAAVDAERNDWRDEVAQRDETIRQLQDQVDAANRLCVTRVAEVTRERNEARKQIATLTADVEKYKNALLSHCVQCPQCNEAWSTAIAATPQGGPTP